MASPRDANGDEESIKPVSDLRSKFEDLAKSKPAPPAPPGHARLAKAHTLPVPPVPDRPRKSLDIPRPTLWSTEESNSAAASMPGDGLKAPRQNAVRALSPRQRPLSMGPFSPEMSPPIVNIESPASSPPDSAKFNKIHLPLRVPQGGSHGSSMGPQLPLRNKPPPPPPPVSRDKGTTSPLNARNLVLPDSDLLASATKKLPPPINRSNKPSAPSTPTATAPPTLLDPRQEEPKPQPSSPFTTPPSSDESPDQRPGSLPTSRKGASHPDRAASASYFSPPSAQRPVEGKRGVSAPLAQGRSDHPEDRPQLPARAPQDVSPRRPARALTPEQHPEGSKRRASPRPPPPRPSEATKGGRAGPEFLPPPKRVLPNQEDFNPPKPAMTIKAPVPARAMSEAGIENTSRSSSVMGYHSDQELLSSDSPASTYPDASRANRRPPWASGLHQIYTSNETRQMDICGRHCCTVGHTTRIYDTSTGRQIFETAHTEREMKTTAVVFKPGARTDGEGLTVWLGTNYGEIQELHLPSQRIVRTRSAHSGREVLKMHRFQSSIWSLDEDGRLQVWPPDESGVPNLQVAPFTYRVARGHTFSIIVKHRLWFASGKEIRIYNPAGGENDFHVTTHALHQSSAGDVVSGAVIGSQPDRVYFGHTDGKVSIYAAAEHTCISVVNASTSRISCLAGGGDFLWAGFSTGKMFVWDTRQEPWLVRKEWMAHSNPVVGLVVDKTTAWNSGNAVLASLGLDKTICLWDGWLEGDFIEADLQEHDVEYCEFREIKAVVMTWNAGASTPGTMRAEDKDSNFFREIIQTNDPPDLLIFGFQELVNLEDKKLTAKSLFKGAKKKDHSEREHMSRQYREWKNYLTRVIEDYMPASEPYTLLQTANLVGLFSCMFVKSSQRGRIRDVQTTEVKRGLGGLHGNKGALIVRFVFDDSSFCFANCHLAAGQSHTSQRNEDITAILESTNLSKQTDAEKRIDHFIGGGDGSMMMDHEICFVNGDLNYRIDSMARETVIKAVRAGNLTKLLERDQLLLSRRRNPTFRLRAFAEHPIAFAPTYKYDLGTDTYDTSEKSRSPAWCDRILFRGVGRIKQLQYRRHEGLRMSDHRPVTGTFLIRIKKIQPDKREYVRAEGERRLGKERQQLAKDAKLDYLVSVLGVGLKEANELVSK